MCQGIRTTVYKYFPSLFVVYFLFILINSTTKMNLFVYLLVKISYD